MRPFISNLFIFDLLIHITFLFIILFMFFQFVGIKEERGALVSNIDSNSKKLLNKNEKLEAIKLQYQKMTPQEKNIYMNLLFKKIEDNNLIHKTKNNYYIISGYFILVALLLGSIYLAYTNIKKKRITKIQVGKCILNNLILFSIIAVIEILFFFSVILKFQPITNQKINDIFTSEYNRNIKTDNIELRNTK